MSPDETTLTRIAEKIVRTETNSGVAFYRLARVLRYRIKAGNWAAMASELREAAEPGRPPPLPVRCRQATRGAWTVAGYGDTSPGWRAASRSPSASAGCSGGCLRA